MASGSTQHPPTIFVVPAEQLADCNAHTVTTQHRSAARDLRERTRLLAHNARLAQRRLARSRELLLNSTDALRRAVHALEASPGHAPAHGLPSRHEAAGS